MNQPYPFELPLNGTTGFASIGLSLYDAPAEEATVLAKLKPGKGFLILEETGDWWKVLLDGQEGYLCHTHCMVNLADLLPSLIYSYTNAKAAVMTSSGKDIPTITGQQLYQAEGYNPRFGTQMMCAPLLYDTAKKLAVAQKLALAEGNSIMLYEAFRPYGAQQRIVEALDRLSQQDPEVRKGITEAPWEMDWFICTGVSNHQIGYAVDVALAKVTELSTGQVGNLTYQTVSGYSPYEMPSPIHELSTRSASLTEPVTSRNDQAWRTVPLAPTMNRAGILLRHYFTEAGMTPLASEWWHFNNVAHPCHPDSRGQYYMQELYSRPPVIQQKEAFCE